MRHEFVDQYQELTATDPNMLGVGENPEDAYYRILVDRSKTVIIAKLEELKSAIKCGDRKPFEFGGLKALWFGRHLYVP